MITDEALKQLLREEVEIIKSKNLPNPLVEIYTTYLDLKARQERENVVRSKDYLHASELPGCMRAVVLKYFDFAEKDKYKTVPSRRRFDNGHSFHDRMKKAFRMSGVLLEEEGEVINPIFLVGGSWDGLIDVGYGIELLELKSANQWSFSSKTGLPMESHKQQVTVYMATKEVYRTRFYYECKNTNEPLEVVYNFEEEMFEKVLGRAAIAWRYINAIKAKAEFSPLVSVMKYLKNSELPLMTCIMKNQNEAKMCDCREACFTFKEAV